MYIYHASSFNSGQGAQVTTMPEWWHFDMRSWQLHMTAEAKKQLRFDTQWFVRRCKHWRQPPKAISYHGPQQNWGCLSHGGSFRRVVWSLALREEKKAMSKLASCVFVQVDPFWFWISSCSLINIYLISTYCLLYLQNQISNWCIWEARWTRGRMWEHHRETLEDRKGSWRHILVTLWCPFSCHHQWHHDVLQYPQAHQRKWCPRIPAARQAGKALWTRPLYLQP
jgi:hypothetical protein